MKYDSAEQANLRLKGTYILYDGELMQCGGCPAEGTVALYTVPGQRGQMVVNLDDPKLNMSDFRLGYVNKGARAGYLTRIPARQQRQGLCQTNVQVDPEWTRVTAQGVNTILGSVEFRDALQNKYPKFGECVDMLKGNPNIRSRAFSRRFALYKDPEFDLYELHYRGQRIAWGDPASFNLPSSHTYLRELIDQEGISVR